MNEKFKGKYRIPSARLQSWHYGWDAAYFVTICTAHRVHYFGDIVKGHMALSPEGVIANILWHEIPHHAPNVRLDAFVVMPNHVHGIVILDGNDVHHGDSGDARADNSDNESGNDVETGHALSLPHPLSLQGQPGDINPPLPPPIGRDRFQNPGKNTLSTIIGSYKSAVTKHARRLGFTFAWQTRFHDHIIRNETSFQRIRHYIRNNPQNWQQDKFFVP